MSEKVTIDNYTRLAERTERIPTGDTEIDPKFLAPLFGAMEVGEDLGRIFDDLKRAIFYGQPKQPERILARLPDCDWEHPPTLKLSPTQFRMLHAACGLITEAMEFLETVARNLKESKPFDPVNIAEELGDLDWYKAIPANVFDLTFEKWLQANIDKLRARYPEKFTPEQAVNRDLAKERAALEAHVTPPKKEL